MWKLNGLLINKFSYIWMHGNATWYLHILTTLVTLALSEFNADLNSDHMRLNFKWRVSLV